MLNHNVILTVLSFVLSCTCVYLVIVVARKSYEEEKSDIKIKAQNADNTDFVIAKEDVSPGEPASEALQEMAALVFNKGDFQLASSLFRQALAAREQVDGSEHLNVASALHGLGASLRQLGKVTEASTFLKRALAVRERAPTPDYAAIAATLQEMAWLAFEGRDYGEAARLFRRVLAIREQTQGLEHLDVAGALHGLGDIPSPIDKSCGGQASP
jgi:tetratricopeptide (TPR) repeat protein